MSPQPRLTSPWLHSHLTLTSAYTKISKLRYEGSFQGFNTTALVEANKEDDLFREFEDSFARMESPMGRSDFTEEEKDSVI